jgi:hypothetical protein
MNISIDDLDGQLLDGLEFCVKSYALFEKLRAEPWGDERLLLHCPSPSIEKRLLEEILPICRYIQTNYSVGRYISVRWIDGNQSFDAELYESSNYVTQDDSSPQAYLEVTSAMHKNEHWGWQLLAQSKEVYAPEGIDTKKDTPLKSEVVVFTNGEYVQNFVPIVVASIQRKLPSDKSKFRYPENTSLLVQCHLNNIYTSGEWQLLVSEVERQVAVVPFREILLIDAATKRIASLNTTA